MKPIILTHVGTNQFVRETYIPDVWRHRYSLADKNGKLKTETETQVYDLAGPMCFQVRSKIKIKPYTKFEIILDMNFVITEQPTVMNFTCAFGLGGKRAWDCDASFTILGILG